MTGPVLDVNEIDVLIGEIGRRGYMFHQFHVDRNGPDVLAAVFRWQTCADVLILVDDRQSHAYRTPAGNPDVDVFSPTCVHWFYGRSAEVGMAWVMRALLTLPRPGEPGGLPALVRAPAGIGVRHAGRGAAVISRRPDR